MSQRMKAELQNGMQVTLWPITHPTWGWQGIDQNGEPHLWLKNGHWREDKRHHPLDIKRILEHPTTEEKAA